MIAIKAKATETAAAAGALRADIASSLGNWKIYIKIYELKGKHAQFSLEDSVDAFVGSMKRWVQSIAAPLTPSPGDPHTIVINSKDVPALRVGETGGVMRVSLDEILESEDGAADQTVTWEAFLEAQNEPAVT